MFPAQPVFTVNATILQRHAEVPLVHEGLLKPLFKRPTRALGDRAEDRRSHRCPADQDRTQEGGRRIIQTNHSRGVRHTPPLLGRGVKPWGIESVSRLSKTGRQTAKNTPLLTLCVKSEPYQQRWPGRRTRTPWWALLGFEAINGWRLKAMLGHPPTWRLTELRAPKSR